MDLHLLSIIGFLSLVLVVTNATVTPESDWKNWNSMLPNTPMPKAIRDHLPSGSEERRASADVRKGGDVSSFMPSLISTNIKWGKAASEDQLRNDPNVALYFQEKDLVPGTTTMDLQFTKKRTKVMATFLPRQEAELIPFSSNKFSDILQRFSIIPRSKEAQVMKNTIKECEAPAVEGEDKYCATSLESMVDFSTSRLGTNNVQAVSTEVDKEETQKQKYTITTGGVEKMGSGKAVVCHDRPYVYTVFYCHTTSSTRAYKVSLVGADGTKADAVAVCHTYTAYWNPKHLAFEVLKVKPGATSPFLATKLISAYSICGFSRNSLLVFDSVREKNVFVWNSLISGYARNHMFEEALKLFNQMCRGNEIMSDDFTFATLLKISAELESAEIGKVIHCKSIQIGFVSDTVVANSLMSMYGKTENLSTVHKVFNEMGQRSCASWNVLISGYANSVDLEFHEVWRLVNLMQREGISPDTFTVSILLPLCGSNTGKWD
ncbi:hypothetical protein NE237_025460 [Protea cynaroides]|uniref:BURP domain-containing protein n=1 Tax=Protea cynaroides TaxID=273540 RepID=A0A9Q0H367_9MAGN|nr:hypothetical protein NE237_025460 [Protea cynaroides]